MRGATCRGCAMTPSPTSTGSARRIATPEASNASAMTNRIVVCPEPLAAAAGAEIFRAGGSAVDAALATAYAQAVVSPAMTTLAGSGVMNLYHAPSQRNVVIDFLDQAGSGAHADMFADASPGNILLGYKSMLVPTFVRGTELAFEQFASGRVAWQRLLE